MKTVGKRYIELLRNLYENNRDRIENIEIIDENEKNRLLVEFNDTELIYPKEKTIKELFEEQVKRKPNEIAMVFEGKEMTYNELNIKANLLARALRDKGIDNKKVVGIMIERSLEMIVGIIGILKSGAAYLPIDSKYPKTRVSDILNDANVSIVVSSEKLSENIDDDKIIIDVADPKLAEEKEENLENTSKPEDLAYVIYTSGSTGKPKGVMIENRQFNNFIHAMVKEIDMKSYRSILCITTISFDIFGLETLVPLTKGLKIVITNDNEQVEGDKLAKIIENNEVEIAQFTPSRLNALIGSDKLKRALNKVKVVLVGGEAVTSSVMSNLETYEDLKIYNVYGPTETTVWSTVKLLKHDEQITIGKPIGNTQIYIMDRSNKIVPQGIVGDLWIGGDGLARGYLNSPDLTEERFVQNPFNPKGMIYKTGDLAKWNNNGNIEFGGRVDDQIKLRGYRIELGEIESVYSSHEDINEVIVLAKENKYLCAFMVCKKEIESRELREFGRECLPEYMIPAYFVQVDKIPLKMSGKIDKKNLLKIEVKKSGRDKVLPRSLQENIIAEIWKEILDVDEVYVGDDFFELGGNSINIIEVARKIEDQLNVDVVPADLMVNSRVIDLAEHLLKKNTEQSKLKNIFKINNSKSDKNIFIVHGADGDIFYYRYLAKLLEEEYSVYGIQPRGLGGKDPLPQSYYEMLSNYINEIREIQSEGPYIISGYCVGGYMAFDIVALLELQGDKVGALVELDQEPFIEKRLYKNVSRVNKVLKGIELVRKATNKDKSYTMKKLERIISKKHVISEERQNEIISTRDNIFEFFCKELMRESRCMYLSKTVKSPTIVIKAEENDNRLFEQESWDNMTTGSFEFIEIPGGHETMVLPPYVEKLAEIILEYLDRTLAVN